MGLTRSSVGRASVGRELPLRECLPTVALAGNPNVGKSTVFNALTGMEQHTGNWPGKTVACAAGIARTEHGSYNIVDLPGTYSLLPHSAEEEIARDYICFGASDKTVVVADATCLCRNLNLVLQTIEATPNVILAVNLLDEAEKKHIKVDIIALSQRLGIPVVGITARKKKSLRPLCDAIAARSVKRNPYMVAYPAAIESAIAALSPILSEITGKTDNARFFALRLLYGQDFYRTFAEKYGDTPRLTAAIAEAETILQSAGISDRDSLEDRVVRSLSDAAETICRDAVVIDERKAHAFDRRVDRLLTGRYTAYPLMLLLLFFLLFLTVTAANYPSKLLSFAFMRLESILYDALVTGECPPFLRDLLIFGAYRVLSWVIAVMLPPMAIFFPLFTLLEDAGFLPRVAYNLDRPFAACDACGKQALTICMGFGCNAAGVVGCRIIDSPRERRLAMLTNVFTPCNGRFPMLVTVISTFLVGGIANSGLTSAAILTGVIVFSLAVTFGVTKLLSLTFCRGLPSSFTLEMPPYRRPEIGKVLVRSLIDRTLSVLGRAAAVAAPAGLCLYLLANLSVGGTTLLSAVSGFLEPLGRLCGLDGVILTAFILGFPANEIVIPIALMAYTSAGVVSDVGDTAVIAEILRQNGWHVGTAVCFVIFTVCHFPCSTTLLTIRKESGSIACTAVAAVLPTLVGILLCTVANAVCGLLGV